MAESIIRHQVANSTISEVIANRSAIRDKIRHEMQAVVQGWGVWLETVEITDVVICSASLFEDLQAPYRQETHASAEQIRLETRQELEEGKLASKLYLARQQTEADRERKVHEAQQMLMVEQERASLLEEQIRIKKVRQEQEHELARMNLEHTEALATQRHEQELARRGQALALDNTMTPLNMKRQVLETVERIYAELPLNEVKLVNMGSDQGVESLLTSVIAGVRQVGEELEG
jgi:hypothetical protein